MKKLLLASLYFMVSCGSSTNGTGTYNSLGEIRSFPTVPGPATSVDNQNVVAICNALKQKESILDSSLNTNHTFVTSQTDCEGKVISSGTATTSLLKEGMSYVFKRSDGVNFTFPEVETSTHGIFTELCSSVSNLVNPIIGESEVTYFKTVGISPEHCSPIYGEVCIEIEKAVRQEISAVVRSKEWIRIRTNSSEGRIGFFTQRKKVTKSFCGNNQFLTFSATVK